jgi:hypothetical protein
MFSSQFKGDIITFTHGQFTALLFVPEILSPFIILSPVNGEISQPLPFYVVCPLFQTI